ncbi:hypothetical protein [Plectonema radiosum]|nr:hypothetical protein [Plectonema radiosum]
MSIEDEGLMRAMQAFIGETPLNMKQALEKLEQP